MTPHLWRTHSCVPRSHSCERAGVYRICELGRRLRQLRGASVHTIVNAARISACATALLLLTGCAVGPNYKRPVAIVAPAYKEPPPDTFKEAQAAGLLPANPADAFQKGKWWEIYQDPALNALEEQVNIGNQNVLGAEASYRQAKAAVRVARAGLFPTV